MITLHREVPLGMQLVPGTCRVTAVLHEDIDMNNIRILQARLEETIARSYNPQQPIHVYVIETDHPERGLISFTCYQVQ